MSLWGRLAARRRGKAHRRYESERKRQQRLQNRDPQDAVRDAARGIGGGVGSPHNS
jgi:hypothetical protein